MLDILRQSAGYLIDFNQLGIFRDYTPEFFCCKNASISCGGFIPTKPLMFGRFSVQKYREDDHKRKFNPLFCSYITGLIEGDGTIIVPKTVRSPSGQANYGSIEIVFDARDLPLAVLKASILPFSFSNAEQESLKR
jgi:hypothetical protein